METYDANKSTTEVRQGSPRMMNMRVLIISLVVVVAAFGIIFAISSAMQPGGGASVVNPSTEQTAPAASSLPNSSPPATRCRPSASPR